MSGPFDYLPDEDGCWILFLGKDTGELCWTNFPEPIVDTYESDVDPDEILEPLKAISRALPTLFGQPPNWGEEGLKRGEVWAICKMGTEGAAVRCCDGAIGHELFSRDAHQQLIGALEGAMVDVTDCLGGKPS